MESRKFPWWIGFPASFGFNVMGAVAPTFTPVGVQAALFVAGALAVLWSSVAGFWHYRHKRHTIDVNLTAYQFSHYLTGESDWGWRVRHYRRRPPEFLRDLAADIRLNGSMMVPGEFQRVAQVASNGLSVSGTRQGSQEPEKIDPVFWTTNSLSLESTYVPVIGETASSVAPKGTPVIYENIRINRADTIRLWPRRNWIKRLRERWEKHPV